MERRAEGNGRKILNQIGTWMDQWVVEAQLKQFEGLKVTSKQYHLAVKIRSITSRRSLLSL